MKEIINLKIITPAGIYFNDKSLMVIMPGDLGNFAVLAKHEPLIASLCAGIVVVKYSNSQSKFYIDKAIAKTDGFEIIILTEFVIKLDDLKIEELQEKLVGLKLQIAKEIHEGKADLVKLDISRYESLLQIINQEKDNL